MKTLAKISCSLLLTMVAENTFAQEKPNIIVFLVDDMGLMDTSVPFIVDRHGNPVRQPLNEWYRTPNMERLAKQGVRFSTFYAQHVSSPSRVSILTGQGAARHRITNWIDHMKNNRTAFGPYGWNWEGLNSKDLIYPAVLQKAGYKTIHVGKGHLGCRDSEADDLTKLGYDVNIAGSSVGHPGSYYGEYGYGWIKGYRNWAVPGLKAYHHTPTFLTEALTLEANKEIEKAVAAKQPFYLNMSHYAVHAPFDVDKRFISHYQSSEKNDEAKAFATLIEGMDKSLGDILDKLEELGVAENTFIIFLGDNGSNAPLGGNFGKEGKNTTGWVSCAPLRGKKATEYEGGIRVPFIASWAKPDSKNAFQRTYPIAENRVQTQMATILDIYPTVLSVAGIEVPDNHVLDGSDLKKLLQGKTDKMHRDDFLMHYPHENFRTCYFTAYRKGDWKLIYYYHPEKGGIPSYQLFNLAKDPYEKKDLSASEPKIVKKMCRLMIARLKMENAQYPIDKAGKTLYPVLPDSVSHLLIMSAGQDSDRNYAAEMRDMCKSAFYPNDLNIG